MRASRNVARHVLAVVTVLTFAVLGLWAAQTAGATGSTRYVSTGGSDTNGQSFNECLVKANPCKTLRHAVSEADAGDTISIKPGSYPESLDIRSSLTLVGGGISGSGKTSITGDDGPSITVDGFENDTPPSVTVENLDVSGNADFDGVRVESATLTVRDSAVSNNDADGIELTGISTASVSNTTIDGNGDDGLQIDNNVTDLARPSAAPDAASQATLTNVEVSHNGETGVYVAAGTAGVTSSVVSANALSGVVAEAGTATVTETTLDKNELAGVVAVNEGVIDVARSTISNSKPASGEEEDLVLGAGAFAFVGGTVNLTDSTVFANSGDGVLVAEGEAHVVDSTISGTKQPPNEPPSEGGGLDVPYGGIAIFNPPRTNVTRMARSLRAPALTPADVLASVAKVSGSIIADNTSLKDCNGVVTDNGYNLASDASCKFTAAGSVNKGTAKLGPLAGNGGPTKTLKPAKGSDAIDAIPTGKAGCSSNATDQRGVSRPQGSKCDIGAVEVDQPALVVAPNTLPHGTVGKAYHVKLTATGGLGAPYEFSLAAGSALPPGLTLDSGGTISGAPTQAGTFTFTVSVDDPVLKTYTIVVAAAATSPTSAPPLSNTGANVTPLTVYGLLALALGLLLTFGGLARYAGRHRGH